MIDVISLYDNVQTIDQRIIDGKLGLADDKYIYFIMTIDDKEVIHMEQATLARFLVEQGFHQVTYPIANKFGQWITEHEDQRYMVYKYAPSPDDVTTSHEQLLARFHQINQQYPFEPNHISSYGQWKPLWIEKLTSFERSILAHGKRHLSYDRVALDMLPYIIGISENAIQYLDESIRYAKFDNVDQGTITFQRYHHQLLKPIIWADELMYDHPMRDLAELMRSKLWHDDHAVKECQQLLNEYMMVRPLSPLSWRLLYARLVFPIHFFDVFGDTFQHADTEESVDQLMMLVKRQPIYEQRLTELFKRFEFRDDDLVLPMIEWI